MSGIKNAVNCTGMRTDRELLSSRRPRAQPATPRPGASTHSHTRDRRRAPGHRQGGNERDEDGRGDGLSTGWEGEETQGRARHGGTGGSGSATGRRRSAVRAAQRRTRDIGPAATGTGGSRPQELPGLWNATPRVPAGSLDSFLKTETDTHPVAGQFRSRTRT